MRSLAGLLRGRLARPETPREVVRTDDEWRRTLTAEQHRVLRGRGTQAPFGADAARPDADGMYRCGGCAAPLFPAGAKFDSGTGWPSFSDAAPDAVERRRDLSMGLPRTEVLCRRCGGHLGHVFRDGPRPTGDRYCINDCALATHQTELM